jgi:hypothetical protein
MLAQAIVLSAFAAVAAAASACTQTATVTIAAQADVTAISSCSTFDGSIEIASTASGTIALDGIGQITGSLTASNASLLTGLTSTTINSIGEVFTLTDMTTLSTVQFDALTSAKTIFFQTLPALSSFTFPEEISTCNSLTILNTFLNSLDGINLNTADVIEISDNTRLTKFSTQIANVTTSIDVASNGKSLVVEFPNLIWAANMTLRNVSSISIPSLAVVNGSLGFYGSYFTSLSAANLTSVGSFSGRTGGITIDDNTALSNITFPELTSSGGLFQIDNNPDLNAISFSALAEIGGALDFTGNFTTPDLPKLSNVVGGLNIQSEQSIDCSTFTAMKGNIVQGTDTCKSGTSTTTTTTGGSSTTSGGASSSSSSKAAAVSYGVNEGLVGLSVIASLFRMML